MDTGHPLQTHWGTWPSMSAISFVSWIVSRDRPKGRRGIASWNLSLVLHQLAKAPFEPLKEASLKHLTLKTVFLLAMGSGKRRSEIQPTQEHQNSVRLVQGVSLLFIQFFFQLAKEGPDSVVLVVIPSLAPIVKSFKGDRSLCHQA